MAAEFLKCFDMQGFDRYNAPRWQMVPVGGVRYVLLRDGAGLTVTSSVPAMVAVTEVKLADLPTHGRQPMHHGDRFFKLEGKAKGSAQLDARSAAGAAVVSLEVDTKNKKTVTVAYNFVKDTATPPHHTRRVPAASTEWLRGINHVYNGQANIFFTQKRSQWVTVGQDLGTVVRWAQGVPGTTAADHEWPVVVAQGDATANMNFFLVWEYEQDATPNVDDTDAGTLGGNCLFEDNAGSQVPTTMAHEIGHFLGRPDHYILARKRELMYGITDQRGVHLPKGDVNSMNP